MTDLTSTFDILLKAHDAHLTFTDRKPPNATSAFLKEAYQISSLTADLSTDFLSIRQSYLSISQPPRRTRTAHAGPPSLTDQERDRIDAEGTAAIRNLHALIRQLADAEAVRQSTEDALAARRTRGALGRWVAGGGAKSAEEQAAEGGRMQVRACRESVLWFLRKEAERVGERQRGMMEVRIGREVERQKSSGWRVVGTTSMGMTKEAATATRENEEAEQKKVEAGLSPEQVQMLAEENRDMLREYEDTLGQVRNVERSMVELSEMQTTILQALSTQSEHIDQLVTDNLFTAENVSGGNKELKRATERKSTARMMFYASCGLSAFLIVWDLVF